jgi:hypothetical protein
MHSATSTAVAHTAPSTRSRALELRISRRADSDRVPLPDCVRTMMETRRQDTGPGLRTATWPLAPRRRRRAGSATRTTPAVACRPTRPTSTAPTFVRSGSRCRCVWSGAIRTGSTATTTVSAASRSPHDDRAVRSGRAGGSGVSPPDDSGSVSPVLGERSPSWLAAAYALSDSGPSASRMMLARNSSAAFSTLSRPSESPSSIVAKLGALPQPRSAKEPRGFEPAESRQVSSRAMSHQRSSFEGGADGRGGRV